MKKLLCLGLILVVGLTLILTGCQANRDKTLIVGFDEGFPPMGYRDKDTNELVGFDLDLAREVAKRLDYKLELKPIAWASKDAQLKSKAIDCVWNGFTLTEKRKTEYAWTKPYMKNAQIVLVAEGSSYRELVDLAGKTVGLQSGSSASDALDASPAFKNSLNGAPKEFKDNTLALLAIDAGQVDCVVMDECVANYYMNKNQNKYRNIGSLTEEVFGVGFRLEDTALRDKVQNALLDMKNDGTLAQISNKWFGKDVTIIE